MSTRRESMLAHGLLLAVVAVWGSTFVLVKASLRDCTPLLFNNVRMVLAFAVLAAINHRHLRSIPRSVVAAGAVAGGFLALGYELQTAGLAHTTPAKSAFLTGLVVVIVPLLSVFPMLRPSRGRSPGAVAFGGAALAFLGIVLLTTPLGTPLRSFGNAITTGDLLSLLCAVAFALHLLSLARMAPQVPVQQLATLQIGFAALAMTVATPVLEQPRLHLTGALILAWLITALFATAAAFSVQTWAQQHLPATHTALLLALEPAFAWAISLIFFHEHLNTRSAWGAAFILGGLLLSELFSPAGPVSEQPEGNQPASADLLTGDTYNP